MMILAATGCSSFGDGSGDGLATSESSAEVAPVVSVPPERLTSFCEAMSDLSSRLAADEDPDTRQLIIDVYSQVVDDVPPVIAADFNAVLVALRTGEPIPTIADSTDQSTGSTAESQSGDSVTLAEEGTLPGATPGERIQDYVNFTCLGTANNPGPPATAPP